MMKLLAVTILSAGLATSAMAQTATSGTAADRSNVQQNTAGEGGNIPPKPAASGAVDSTATNSTMTGSSTMGEGSKKCNNGGQPGDAANSGNLPNNTGTTVQGTNC